MTVTRGTDLERLLARLHDRGAINESALLDCFADLLADQTLTRDHLVHIFGVEVYRLITVTDETRKEFLKEAVALLTDPECRISLPSFLKAVAPFVEE